MEGTRVSHYEVLEQLGRGGMGVVYKALDTRLNRHVALKFLPPEMTSDDEARQRFTTESQAASALDHPNICTIYEVDADPDGRMFIAMAFYDGETLKQRMDRGPLAINEALEIAVQMARGLAKAHAAGIVHRDVKPANVMITGDGLAKVLDFGIAKLTGVTGLTKTGSTLGTGSYMSPEQVHGEDVGAGSDVWSLGAVLYEMLAGGQAFDAANAMALIYAITSEAPAPLRSLRPEVPAEVEAVVTRALEKAPADRFASAEELASALEPCLPRAGIVVQRSGGEGRRARWWGAAAVAAVALLAGGLWASGAGDRDRERVLQVAVPEIEALALEGLFDSAWVVLRHAEKVAPDEPALEEMWPLITWTMGALRTEPSGARVLLRAYGSSDDTPWELLGTTPLETFRLPWGNTLLKIEAEGYQASYLAPLGVGVEDALTAFPLVTLDLEGEAPENMVRVPGLDVTIGGTAHALEDFYIDRFEVTNGEFQTFVDDGGYRNPQYWEHPFVLDGRTLSRDEAMERFVDQMGRPGPSTWQVANYPDGQDDYPVTGVSWYEAAAYAKFAGKSLPSVHHWRRAYGTEFSLPYVLPRSNFAGDGPAPVGEYTGMGPFGTFDMAGNAREWVFNAVGEDRYMLGGGWTDPDYVGVDVLSRQYTQPPFDRSPTNGIRLVQYPEEGPGLQAALAPEARTVVDSPDIPTVDDEVFEVYRHAYAYDPGELNSTVEEADTTRHWIRQRISFDAAYGDERVILYLYLPLTVTAPLQTVVYWGGVGNLFYTSIDQTLNLHPNFIVQSGRALALPVLKGTLERHDEFDAPVGSILQRERWIQMVQDVVRTVDYLETRDDIDAHALAYYGHSWGAYEGPLPLALEPRLKAGILDVANFVSPRRQPEINTFFFIPRTIVPVLMLSGRLDAVVPLETVARPFFDLLGTPEEQKHHFISEAGHFVPMTDVIRESLDFLDRYLGPVGGG